MKTKLPGERIIDLIVRNGMVTLAHPPIPDGESAVFVWSSNAVEQLDSLVEQIVRERNKST